MSSNKCRVEIPNQLPESDLTRVQFKTWKESMIVYLKQNEDYHVFLPEGMYNTWTPGEEDKNRIQTLHEDDQDGEEDEQNKRLTKRRKDLHTMLNIVARKVDQYDFDDVMNMSTSLTFVWNTI